MWKRYGAGIENVAKTGGQIFLLKRYVNSTWTKQKMLKESKMYGKYRL